MPVYLYWAFSGVTLAEVQMVATMAATTTYISECRDLRLITIIAFIVVAIY